MGEMDIPWGCKSRCEREVDVTCDSVYILRIMPEVGKNLRDKFDWVPEEVPIFLYIDNAGGQGIMEQTCQLINTAQILPSSAILYVFTSARDQHSQICWTLVSG